MDKLTTVVQDVIKAAAMQVSIWRWEMQMIANYGLDWGYKEPWERPW